ncbi:aromatic ring-hydroxylating dioxygenase subunit alpha [Aliikangiella marina]|uniref:Aromatic ring-hydroxylating dioxygenase subunit alpha n=2 Tax=Aliikangiella marina TaxID=1712262 RepID=A0A545T5D6_9GAMM|nr:aromatic ring-hydroxylating dioxygenase subunit alpha [Aliikangiella marina]
MPADPDNAFTLPASLYTDNDILKLEYQAIFESHWQLVGHIDQLKAIGDQLICQVGRIPVVVVRNSSNELKAFHNVCRHRAGPVAIKNANDKVLRCKYHGWTYTLDGELRSAPEMNSTPHFDVCQYHLPQAKIETWQGFVFVCINESPPALDDLLEGIQQTILPIDLSTFSFSHRDEYLIDCNWKVYMDNYLEGYHLPHVHPGLNKLLDYRSYDTILHRWHSYQYSPLDNPETDDSNFYGDGQAHYYCVFPNLMLNILPGRLQTNIIIPDGVEKTKIYFDYYYDNMGAKETESLIAKDREFSDEIQEEDIMICEQVQKGLNSGSYQAGRLCMKRESGVLHFQDLIRHSLKSAYTDD